MPLSTRFEEALVFAHQLHAAQLRKGTGTPYVAHLLGVASIALEHGADEDEAIAALLHDAIEDQGGDTARQEIRTRFGERVTEIVDGCTDAETDPKPPWRERKEAYLAHLPEAPRSVLLVSASDKLYNARALLSDLRVHGETLWSRFQGGREGTLWYYRALADTYMRIGQHRNLVNEVQLTVTEIERLAGAKTGDSLPGKGVLRSLST